jgi:hypothetical protein
MIKKVIKIIKFFYFQELKKLVLGSSLALYCDEWRNQYFEFNKNEPLYYGLVQKKVSETFFE